MQFSANIPPRSTDSSPQSLHPSSETQGISEKSSGATGLSKVVGNLMGRIIGLFKKDNESAKKTNSVSISVINNPPEKSSIMLNANSKAESFAKSEQEFVRANRTQDSGSRNLIGQNRQSKSDPMKAEQQNSRVENQVSPSKRHNLPSSNRPKNEIQKEAENASRQLFKDANKARGSEGKAVLPNSRGENSVRPSDRHILPSSNRLKNEIQQKGENASRQLFKEANKARENEGLPEKQESIEVQSSAISLSPSPPPLPPPPPSMSPSIPPAPPPPPLDMKMKIPSENLVSSPSPSPSLEKSKIVKNNVPEGRQQLFSDIKNNEVKLRKVEPKETKTPEDIRTTSFFNNNVLNIAKNREGNDVRKVEDMNESDWDDPPANESVSKKKPSVSVQQPTLQKNQNKIDAEITPDTVEEKSTSEIPKSALGSEDIRNDLQEGLKNLRAGMHEDEDEDEVEDWD